ncbi:hypothetical protein [Streptomyces olivaceiscleroticus]|uniref:Uncharacterized protein n=1 Tax=Streptomyces olivaceiscleroticus TaxID=68245 RepID=A0ABN1A2K5_9ACTN
MYWYSRLVDTHSDLCAAMEHLLATDPPEAVELIGSIGSIGFFCVCCGHYDRLDAAYLAGLIALLTGRPLAATIADEAAGPTDPDPEAYWRATGPPQRGMPELSTMRKEGERAARAAATDHIYEKAFRQGRAEAPVRNLTLALESIRA